MEIFIQAILLAVLGGIIFTIIGIVPGTDETATMAPLTLILVLLGFQPPVLFAWYMAIIAAMQIAHVIPTAMAALPGSTMNVPMVYNCSLAKRMGIPHVAIRKMAAGSLIGQLIAFPIAILFALALAPVGQLITPYVGLVFTIGTVVVAYMSRAKWGAIAAIIPFAFLIQGFQRLAVESVGKTLFISIFMGITIGPMIAEIFNVMIPSQRSKQMKDKPNEIWLAPEQNLRSKSIFPNPFKILTKRQNVKTLINSAISTCTFTMSPVGMTVMLGELSVKKKPELYDKVTTTLAVQESVTNATYTGGLIIPLIAFLGLPLSAIAVGPAAPLFNAPPVFTVDPLHNLGSLMTLPNYIIFGIIGIIGGVIISYPVSIKKARSWTLILFKKIGHEALIGAFVGLICLLAFHEAGFMGIIVALSLGLIGGFLHTHFGIHTGVQFMAYYASGWIVTNLFLLAKIVV